MNTIIKDLHFFPINGYRFRLSELKHAKAIVIIMRERDCPISEKYGPRLARLEEKYSKLGIKFIYNYVGEVDSLQNGKKDLKRFGFKGPYVYESNQKTIEALSVKTTGDVFIMTPERRVIYKGPLDDQYHLLKSAIKPRNHYVVDILDAILSGEKIIPKEIPAPGCVVSRPIVKEKLFYSDVAPIIRKKCTVCHNPSGSGPIDYISYKDVIGRLEMFKYVIENELMPPWPLDPNTGPWINDLSLTSKERAMLLNWINAGGLNPTPPFFSFKFKKDLLSVKEKPKKFQSTPDYVISLPEAVTIPAEGFYNYKRFIVQTKFKEDKWIKGIRPVLKSKVVHHLSIDIMDPLFTKDISHTNILKYSLDRLAFNNSVSSEFQYNALYNAGVLLPRNSKIALEIHYESIGRKIIDNSSRLDVFFYKKPPKYKSTRFMLENNKIKIPPYQSNCKSTTLYKIEEAISIWKIGMHMHLRGKAGDIFIVNPFGERKRIFGIDTYTKSSSAFRTLKKPIMIPQGSIIECTTWFDNSEKNPINPAPEKYVTYGGSSQDEMSICLFRLLSPIHSSKNITHRPSDENTDKNLKIEKTVCTSSLLHKLQNHTLKLSRNKL